MFVLQMIIKGRELFLRLAVQPLPGRERERGISQGQRKHLLGNGGDLGRSKVIDRWFVEFRCFHLFHLRVIVGEDRTRFIFQEVEG